MRTHFIGIGAIQVGLRSVYIFLAVTVFSQLVIGLGLGGAGSRFCNLFGTIAALRFFSVGARLFEGSLELPVVEGDQDLARLDGVAFAHENFINAAADFGADADVARLDGAGALEGGVAPEPAGVERSGGDHGGQEDEEDDALAGHGTNLPALKMKVA